MFASITVTLMLNIPVRVYMQGTIFKFLREDTEVVEFPFKVFKTMDALLTSVCKFDVEHPR